MNAAPRSRSTCGPRGALSTSSRATLNAKKTSTLFGNKPLPLLPSPRLRSVQAPDHEAANTFLKVRLHNATQVVPSLSDIDSLDDWGWTPLMHAAEQNHKEMHVKKLLVAGADANARSTRKYGMYEPGVTALDIARRVQDTCGFDRMTAIALLEGASAKQRHAMYVEAEQVLGERHSHEAAVLMMQTAGEANAKQAAERRAALRAVELAKAEEAANLEAAVQEGLRRDRAEMMRRFEAKYGRGAGMGTGKFAMRSREQMQELFDEIDTDGGGTLDVREIKALADKLGVAMTKRELDKAMLEMDEDCSGEVDFEEFAEWWPKQVGKNSALVVAMNDPRVSPEPTASQAPPPSPPPQPEPEPEPEPEPALTLSPEPEPEPTVRTASGSRSERSAAVREEMRARNARLASRTASGKHKKQSPPQLDFQGGL